MLRDNPLIIALDTSSSMKALLLVRRLKVCGVAFKVGYELFTSAGPRIVQKIMAHDVRVFLDLKYHDIPHTVARAADLATRMGVWMFTVHTSGGSDMMRGAKDASLDIATKKKLVAPLVMGVTVLTSLENLSEQNVSVSLEDQVVHLARLAQRSGMDGVVASAQESRIIMKSCGRDFVIVSPGIRLSDGKPDDQKRLTTPEAAIASGSRYLVVGRLVTETRRPLKAVERLLSSLKRPRSGVPS